MRILLLICLTLLLSVAAASADTLRIYLDADRSTNITSARSIEIGMRGAFATSKNVIQGHKIEFVLKDHRSNARRTQRHLEEFLQDEQAIAVIGGLHSPPYLNAKAFVNDHGIPLLLPWSAAAPLTRSNGGPNSIFRLSLDDSIAAEVIIPFALEQSGCEAITLLLWESGWGKSNERTMSAALNKRGLRDFSVRYFGSGLTDTDAISIAAEIAGNGSDCAILVGNAPEGKTILNALTNSEIDVRVFSHWGITGGSFEHDVTAQDRDAVDLTFIQPCFDFRGRDAAAQSVLANLSNTFGDAFDSEGYLPAPAGLFHGYDLGLILVHALERIDLDQPITHTRRALVNALERIEGPIPGLLRDYEQPFSPAHSASPDAHEALRASDFCMARFDESNRIVPIRG